MVSGCQLVLVLAGLSRRWNSCFCDIPEYPSHDRVDWGHD